MKKSLITIAMLSVCSLVQAATSDTIELDELTALSGVTPGTQYSNLISSAAFTISFDLSDVTTDGYLLSLSPDTYIGRVWRNASVQIVNDNITLYGVGDTQGVSTDITKESLNNTTLTLTGKNTGNDIAVLTLYADGVQIAQATSASSATNWFGENDHRLNIDFGQTSDSATAVYSNVYYSASSALTAEQVSSIIDKGNIPEPTTATLSLLALGALALRRHRK